MLPTKTGIYSVRRDQRWRRKAQGERIQHALESWSNEFLADRQGDDPDLAAVREWMGEGVRPIWEDVWGSSSSLKAYWKQCESLGMVDGVLYRTTEPPTVPNRCFSSSCRGRFTMNFWCWSTVA